MTVKITRDTEFFYEGFRRVIVKAGTELSDCDECARHALAHGYGVPINIKAGAPENKALAPDENKTRKSARRTKQK